VTRRSHSVMHIISGLPVGGAESMLYKLVSRSAHTRSTHEVVSLTTVGPVGARLQAEGIKVVGLGMPNGVPDPRGLVRLVQLLRQHPPALVQTWMYHADLLGGIAAKLSGKIPVVWGVRNTEIGAEKFLLKFLARVVNPPLSHWVPDAIVCCAERAREVHVAFGYAREKCIVIPNGFDMARFQPNWKARAALRTELEIPPSSPVVGMVARLHPMKDHGTFLTAAATVAQSIPSAVFVLCGDGLTSDSPTLTQKIRESGLPIERLRLLGRRDDVENIYPALTATVLSSKSGEGFPNVLGEAMACGIPCVATDVGDSALIVGEHGRIVSPRNPRALAAAILEMLRMPDSERMALGLAGRSRIEQRYSIAAIAVQYESLYEGIVSQYARQG
jgi:glycosyltransferase involved in cell wall biosynthesis